ncbi:MAG TPA: hypothetical protein DEZ08_07315 [Dehalococcoidia bacterium]|jgi:signal peptidase I|nr:hypothetical protein [Dehalococcoidia bacterium]|tara:strand:- start:58 stop:519 length:462 start_codon:yes stop_codon:yes gene_type:complete
MLVILMSLVKYLDYNKSMHLLRTLSSIFYRFRLGTSKDSMYPTLPINARFLVIPQSNKEIYKKGDIIVFQDIRPTALTIVKRIAGLPNEDFTIDGKKHFLGPQEYFVLSDRINNTNENTVPYDSRFFGPVPRNKIIGRVCFIFWPLNRFGAIN